jgi:hypothetical protein
MVGLAGLGVMLDDQISDFGPGSDALLAKRKFLFGTVASSAACK